MRGFVISFFWLFFGLGGALAQSEELMDVLEQEGLQNLRVVDLLVLKFLIGCL